MRVGCEGVRASMGEGRKGDEPVSLGTPLRHCTKSEEAGSCEVTFAMSREVTTSFICTVDCSGHLSSTRRGQYSMKLEEAQSSQFPRMCARPKGSIARLRGQVFGGWSRSHPRAVQDPLRRSVAQSAADTQLQFDCKRYIAQGCDESSPIRKIAYLPLSCAAMATAGNE